MKIDKVRIVGFKSFADPTEFVIGPGITAIVGPNGCGKSNLIEALRWGMGETSSKRIRAEGMDDVIFGGTESRQPRASCEVGIFLDNSGRRAPAEFNVADALEVVRRLDRGDGSSYRVNAKTARARDVQVLFQDAGAGASSAALVSQGKVGAIINAKPSDRRSILEEAAGVAGLSTRRHEAEIRLRATEQNLERADELEKGLGEQLSALRRQARQAARRRSIDDLIRSAQAMAFLVRWRAASARTDDTSRLHGENEGRVAEAMLALKAAEAEAVRVEEEVAPALRMRQEAETAHALAKARLEQAEKDIVATRSALASARRNLDRANADLERERAATAERDEEIADFVDRKAMAEDDREHDASLIEEATKVAGSLEVEVSRLLSEVEKLASEAASAEAALRSAEARRMEAAKRVGRIEARVSEFKQRISADERKLAALGDQSSDLAKATAGLSGAEAAMVAATEARISASTAEDEARVTHAEVSAELTAVRAEMRGLRSNASGTASVSERVSVRDDMAAAFAAALGEGFSAGIGTGASRWWVASPVNLDPPAGARALSDFTVVPDELRSIVSSIGVVDTDAEGDVVAERLVPGQSVVSLSGRLWRWDGYRSSGVGSAAEEVRRAARLRQLTEIEPRLAQTEAETLSRRNETRKVSEEARKSEGAATEAVRKCRSALEEVRRLHERTSRERNDLTAAISASKGVLESVMAELDQSRVEADEAKAAFDQLPPLTAAASRLSASRKSMEEVRERHLAARNDLDRATRDAGMRRSLIEGLAQSIEEAGRRKATAEALCVEMAARSAEATVEVARLLTADELAPRTAENLRQVLDQASEELRKATENSALSEARLAEARKAVATGNERLTAMREERARLLAELKAAKDASEELRREIGERLTVEPSDLPSVAGTAVDAELPDLAACEQRVARLARERDGIGVVNLLAEEQVVEMETRLGDAQKAREELREAVGRLRRTIGDFDREARSRLTEAFVLVDGHFKDLFARLFGGGHAHLKLSGSEDILQAGLEIYACPPGKKLQTMSLLSGGEQALAALALIFAAFLVKPAPVCVLDEVDAPLDDANVNRLCSLVTDMARDDATRFLVVTHHALTMARADRLYGVTMAERGVSRIASLDMEAAAAFVGA